MPGGLPDSGPVLPVCDIQSHLKHIVRQLKSSGLWGYLDPPIRGWVELASRLRGVKFRSPKVLSVLMKVLKLLKPFLSLANLFSSIGIPHAWRASEIASSWGHSGAEKWKHDKGYQLYCGILAVQLSRVIPVMMIEEIMVLRDYIRIRGFRKLLRAIWRST